MADLVFALPVSVEQIAAVIRQMSQADQERLRKQFGDALFFENVRDFLGVQTELEKKGRTTPNLEIIKTVRDSPEKMLARNNGLVFGAEKVTPGKKQSAIGLK